MTSPSASAEASAESPSGPAGVAMTETGPSGGGWSAVDQDWHDQAVATWSRLGGAMSRAQRLREPMAILYEPLALLKAWTKADEASEMSALDGAALVRLTIAKRSAVTELDAISCKRSVAKGGATHQPERWAEGGQGSESVPARSRLRLRRAHGHSERWSGSRRSTERGSRTQGETQLTRVYMRRRLIA